MSWGPRLPEEIEAESFRRIEAQVGGHHFPPPVWMVVRRMIHTSADLDYLDSVRLHPRAIAAGVAALRQGGPLATDTRMLLAGVSSGRLSRLGVTPFCLMDDPEVAREARRQGTTRAAAAMEAALPRLAGGSWPSATPPPPCCASSRCWPPGPRRLPWWWGCRWVGSTPPNPRRP